MSGEQVEFYQDKRGKHRWRIVASNGRVIASSSQGYGMKDWAANNLAVIYETLARLEGLDVWLEWRPE